MVVCRCAARSTRLRGKAATNSQSSVLSRERSGHSASCGHRTAYPLRVQSSDRGFTLIELVIVICIVGILSATLLKRVWFYQDQAEKAAMEQVAGALQSALTMKYARLLTRGKGSEISALVAENPMNWLAKIPGNYAGEYYDVTPRSISRGNWTFDLKSRNLIYVVDRSDYFTPGKDGKKWVRYRVNLLYEPVPTTSGKPGKELVGVLFEPTEPYRWFD